MCASWVSEKDEEYQEKEGEKKGIGHDERIKK